MRERVSTYLAAVVNIGLFCAPLCHKNYHIEYLVDRTLVAGQPGIVAGEKKTLKTLILLCMAISLSVGGFFAESSG